MRNNKIDEVDNKILFILSKNGRTSYTDIASELKLSRTSIKNRIAELEERKVITGYKAVINSHKKAEMIPFIMTFETRTDCFEDVKKALLDAKETVSITQTTGNCRLMVVCLANGRAQIMDFINKTRALKGVANFSAHSIIDSIKGNIIPEE